MNKTIIYILPHLLPPKFENLVSETHVREKKIVEYTRKQGYHCELFLLSNNGSVRQNNDDVGSWLFPVDRPNKDNNHNHFSTSLLKRIEQEKPDLIIFKGMGYRLNRWLALNSRHRFKFIFIVGGGTRDILAPYADYILAETQQQIEDNFQEQQRQGRVDILPKLNLPGSFQTSEDKNFDIVNIGGFTKNKNQESLIPLARDYKVAMIGDGLFFDKIQNMIQPFKENVYMPRNLPREEIPSLIARSRLMVHPAHLEGLPRVVMESFACGVPVVASHRAMPNAFEHGVHGLLVEPDQIVPAARELLADEARLKEMGSNAFQYARENCTEEAVFKVIQRMYEKVFSNPPPVKRYATDMFKLRMQSFAVLVVLNLKRAGRALGIKKIKESLWKK